MPVQRPRPTILVSLLTSIVLVAGLVLAAPADAGTAADEQLFVQLVNQTRAGAGLAPLTVHSELRTQARAWSTSMSRTDQLAHAPDISQGISAPWTVLGENVGVHGIQDVQQLYAAFVASPTHYANIVDPRYTSIGVGVVVTESGKLWTTHRFMATVSAPTTTAAPTTTSPPATSPPTTRPTTTPPTTARATTSPPTTTRSTAPPSTRASTRPSTTIDRSTTSTSTATSSTPTSSSSSGSSGSAGAGATKDGSTIADAEPDEQAPAATADSSNDANIGDGGIEPVVAGPGRPDVETVEQMLIDLIEAGI